MQHNTFCLTSLKYHESKMVSLDIYSRGFYTNLCGGFGREGVIADHESELVFDLLFVLPVRISLIFFFFSFKMHTCKNIHYTQKYFLTKIYIKIHTNQNIHITYVPYIKIVLFKSYLSHFFFKSQ